MYIKKIELENIKKYDKAEIEFSSGLNFICGKNGAGKTTIIESIGFALFGFQNGKQGFSNYIIRKGAKKGRIRITFLDKNNMELIADRSISLSSAGNSWSVKKFEDGDEIEIASGTIEVPAYLKDHLEFYPDDDMAKIFEKIVSVPQGEMTAAFFLPEKGRKEEFDPLFKLDTYRAAFQNIKLARDIEDENNEIDKRIASMKGEIITEPSLKEEKKEYDARLKEAKDELKNFEEGEKKVKEEFEAIDKLKKDIDKKDNDIKLKNAEKEKFVAILNLNTKNLNDALASLEILKQCEDGYTKYLLLDKKIQEEEEKFKKYEQIYNEFQTQTKRIEQGNVKVNEREISLNRQKEEIVKLKQLLNDDNAKLKELNDNLLKIKNVNLNNDIIESKDTLFDENETNENTDSNSNASSNKQIDINELKNASEEIIKLEMNINVIKKDLKDSMLALNMPNKEILYLNKAKSNMTTIVNQTEGNVKNLAVEVSENIDRAIDISKMNSEGNVKDTDTLVKEKEYSENKIKDIILSYVKDDNLISRFNDEGLDSAREILNLYISNIEKSANEKTSEIVKIETEIKSINLQSDKTKKQIAEKEELFNKENSEFEKWKKAIVDIQNNVSKMKDDAMLFENIKKGIEVIKKEQKDLKEVYEKYVSNLKKKDEVERYKKVNEENEVKIKELDKVFEELSNELNNLKKGFDLDNYNKLYELNEKSKAGSKLILERISNTSQNVDRINKVLDHFKEVKKEIKLCEIARKENKEVIDIIQKLRSVINDAPQVISDLLIKNISLRAGAIYSDIASDTSRLTWENSYELALFDYINGEEIKKEFRQLSGGEQMSSALSVRIAMLEMLTNLKIGILDEPTTNIDQVRRERLSEIVGNVSENFNQLFVVSHDDTFENITQNVVMLKSND